MTATEMVTLPDFFYINVKVSAQLYKSAAGSLTPYAPVYLKTVSEGFSIGMEFSSSGL
jgi:hypothetical protein